MGTPDIFALGFEHTVPEERVLVLVDTFPSERPCSLVGQLDAELYCILSGESSCNLREGSCAGPRINLLIVKWIGS